MTLQFSTQLNNKPTYFIQKIWRSLKMSNTFLKDYIDETPIKYLAPHIKTKTLKPKIHTIRKNSKKKLKPGVFIYFYVNSRKKGMFKFAPQTPVISTQKIEIVYYTDREVLIKNLPPKKEVLIDGKRLNKKQINELAINDGFESVEDFFDYFNEDYSGDIIHWTDLRY